MAGVGVVGSVGFLDAGEGFEVERTRVVVEEVVSGFGMAKVVVLGRALLRTWWKMLVVVQALMRGLSWVCSAVAGRVGLVLAWLVQRTGLSMSERTSSCRPRHAGLVDLVETC